MKELHLEFVKMTEVVWVNYNHGRKLLTTGKHLCHYLTLLEVVFELGKHPSVYLISSVLPSGPLSLINTSFL